MRALATCAVVLGLIVSPTMARAGGPGDKESANKASAANGSSAANATPAAAPTADPAGKAAPSSMEVESELHQMRDLLEAQAKQLQEQQQKMNQLEEQLKASGSARESLAAAPASAAAPAVSSSINATPADTAKSPQAKAEEKLSDLAYGKVKIGATFYGNFTHYTDTGYAPAFQDLPTTQLAPGNSGLNDFEVTRAYINLFYTPSDHVTLRITPDIYRGSDGSLSVPSEIRFRRLPKYLRRRRIQEDQAHLRPNTATPDRLGRRLERLSLCLSDALELPELELDLRRRQTARPHRIQWKGVFGLRLGRFHHRQLPLDRNKRQEAGHGAPDLLSIRHNSGPHRPRVHGI